MIDYAVYLIMFLAFAYLMWRQYKIEERTLQLIRSLSFYLCVENDVTLDEIDEKAQEFMSERLTNVIQDVIDEREEL